jgi:hypothetical protein
MSRASTGALLGTSLLANAGLHGATLQVVVAQGGGTATVAVLAFLLSTGAFAHALTRIPWPPREATLASWGPPTAWLAMTVGALFFWPAVLAPALSPARSLWVLATFAALPLVLVERVTDGATAHRSTTVWLRIVAGAGLAIGTFTLVRYGLAVRPGIESVDFYYYVAVARDLVGGATDVPPIRYAYFPGVYVFWGAALRAGHGSLNALQWSYLGLLAVNALALAGVIMRVSRSAMAAVFGALWYGIICARFEGFAGTSEPLATFPVLLALLLWGGAPLIGGGGLVNGLALGLGFGLGIYARQQAALLSLGWLWLVVSAVSERTRDRSRWLALLLIPAAATSTLLCLILSEGRGLEPLRWGLRLAQEYSPEAGFLANVSGAGLRNEPLVYSALVMLVAAPALMIVAMRSRAPARPWVNVFGVCIIAGTAALVQFIKRPYAHYLLLAAPFLVVAVVLGAGAVIRNVRRRLPSPAIAFVALALASIPLAPLWSAWHSGEVAYPTPWRKNPDVARDLAALRELVRPAEDLLVLPPRRNEIHLFLGTRSVSFEDGYGWGPHVGAPSRALASPRLTAVVVVRALDETDRAVCLSMACEAAIAELPAAGFHQVAELPTMALWRR